MAVGISMAYGQWISQMIMSAWLTDVERFDGVFNADVGSASMVQEFSMISRNAYGYFKWVTPYHLCDGLTVRMFFR